MKLLNCHIENFGKLSNYNYKFEDGLNTIKEDNGFGKTTFASFIKAMFYGMEVKRNSKVLIDRKKYMPWQGGAFGGNIEFELNGKKYKLERFFGKKEADDTFKLYDLQTNLESKDYSKNIGEEIFKINKEAYERSTFISGQNIETAMNDSINAKLGNILESENDINTSDKAIEILEKAIKNYKKTGDRGEINQKIQEKTALEKKLEQSKINEKILQERREKYNLLKVKLKEKELEKEKLNNLLNLKTQEETKKAKLENYKILENNYEESKTEYEKLQHFFEEGIPSDIEIETLIQKCLLVEKYKVEIKNYDAPNFQGKEIFDLKDVFKDKDISEEKINKNITEYNNIGEIENKIKENYEKKENIEKEKEKLKKEGKAGKKIFVFLVFAILIGIVVSIYSFIQGNVKITVGTLVLGIVLLLAMIKKINSNKKKKDKITEKAEEINEINELIENLELKERSVKKQIEEFISEFYSGNTEEDTLMKLTEIKSKYARYKDLVNSMNIMFERQEEILNKLNELGDSIKKYLLKYFKQLDNAYVTYVQEIKMKKDEFLKQKQDYESKLKAKEQYEEANNIIELKNTQEGEIKNIDKEKLIEKIAELANEIGKINDEKNYNKNQIELLESNLDAVFDIENNIEDLSQKIDEMKENCNILEKTKQYLEIAKEQFSSRYLSKMKKSFISNLKSINGKDMEINLDVKLNVQINEQGGNKEINFFSTGYKDLIYICMRLGLIDSLFEEEQPFLILDDPFVNLDEHKIKNAMNLLNNLAKKYQILYFVCHESRK